MRRVLVAVLFCLLIGGPAAAEEVEYVVQPGDILGAIAQRYDVTVSQLRSWNDISGDGIWPGQTLRLEPGAALLEQGWSFHVVSSGEVLGAIASEHDVTVTQLRYWNDLSGDMIRVGQRLQLRPGSGSDAVAAAALDASLSSTSGRSSGGWQNYTVSAGDNVGSIAARFQVSVDDIVSWNRGLNPNVVRAGQSLRIRGGGRASRRVTYEVQPGDFVGGIASSHNCSVADIVSWNPGLDPDRVQIGQRLSIIVNGPEVHSESVGRASGGSLVNGEQLTSHRGFRIRDRRRAWGTNETITYLREGYSHVLARHPDAPRVWVHDLSYENGGRIGGHRSHQSGRDADIGFYYRGCGSTCDYREFDAEDLDSRRQWTLFRYWIDNDLVDYIFVDYSYQRVLYNWLQENGATERQLNRWIQYPHGRNAARGIMRHEPGHDDHYHVRFSCGGDDRRCR